MSCQQTLPENPKSETYRTKKNPDRIKATRARIFTFRPIRAKVSLLFVELYDRGINDLTTLVITFRRNVVTQVSFARR